MRAIAISLACLATAACDSPTEQAPSQPVAAVPTIEPIIEPTTKAAELPTLSVSGIGIGLAKNNETQSFDFGASRSEVDEALSAVLGVEPERMANEECGAGPMEFSNYRGSFTASFQDDTFIGWFLDGADFDMILSGKGIAIGDPIELFAELHAANFDEESTLGAEWYSETDGIGAFAAPGEDGEVVESMYAGANCFFR